MSADKDKWIADIQNAVRKERATAVTLPLRCATAHMLSRDQAPKLRPLAVSSATGGVVT